MSIIVNFCRSVPPELLRSFSSLVLAWFAEFDMDWLSAFLRIRLFFLVQRFSRFGLVSLFGFLNTTQSFVCFGLVWLKLVWIDSVISCPPKPFSLLQIPISLSDHSISFSLVISLSLALCGMCVTSLSLWQPNYHHSPPATWLLSHIFLVLFHFLPDFLKTLQQAEKPLDYHATWLFITFPLALIVGEILVWYLLFPAFKHCINLHILIFGVLCVCKLCHGLFLQRWQISRPVDDKKLEFGSHKCRRVKYGLIYWVLMIDPHKHHLSSLYCTRVFLVWHCLFWGFCMNII